MTKPKGNLAQAEDGAAAIEMAFAAPVLMLFIQAGNASTDNLNKINGTSGSYFDGAMYFPNGKAQFNGTSGAMTQCAMVVADLVDFTGNTNLQNSLTRPDGTACTGNQTVTANIVRLVE